jgi:hypothetical protein
MNTTEARKWFNDTEIAALADELIFEQDLCARLEHACNTCANTPESLLARIVQRLEAVAAHIDASLFDWLERRIFQEGESYAEELERQRNHPGFPTLHVLFCHKRSHISYKEVKRVSGHVEDFAALRKAKRELAALKDSWQSTDEAIRQASIRENTEAPEQAGSEEQFAVVLQKNPELKEKLELMRPLWRGDYAYLAEVLAKYKHLAESRSKNRTVAELAHHLYKKGWLRHESNDSAVARAVFGAFGLKCDKKTGNKYFGFANSRMTDPKYDSLFCAIQENPAKD